METGYYSAPSIPEAPKKPQISPKQAIPSENPIKIEIKSTDYTILWIIGIFCIILALGFYGLYLVNQGKFQSNISANPNIQVNSSTQNDYAFTPNTANTYNIYNNYTVINKICSSNGSAC